MKKIGVIGYGLRTEYVLKNFVAHEMDVQLVSVYDKEVEAAKKRIVDTGYDVADVTFYETIEEMMQVGNLDGVVIGTRCDSHTDIAIEVMQYGVPLFLEKPVAIDEEQLDRLQKAGEAFGEEVVVSFPLRVSPICQLAKEIIASGKLGNIVQAQAVNNVPYGRVYYHSWYRNEALTGGLFLQKSTHDLDYIHYLLGQQPTELVAMESKQVFKGDKEAGLTCSKCEEYKTCSESTYAIKHLYYEDVDGEGCVFAKDTGNHDSATIMLRYADGMHSVYSQNFVARKAAAKRGVRLIGYKGTLEFDFNTGELVVYSHTANIVENHKVDVTGLHHFGGDKALCENFVGVMNGTEKSKTPLSEGINSARLCLLAKKSAMTNQFCNV